MAELPQSKHKLPYGWRHKLRIATFVLPGEGGWTEAAMSVTATVTLTVSVPEVHATHLLPSHTPA